MQTYDFPQTAELVEIVRGTSLHIPTVLAVMWVAIWLGNEAPTAMFYGCVVSLSSTAIVLRGTPGKATRSLMKP